MLIRELMHLGREQLREWGGTDTVELDSSLLLGHVLNIRREELLARLSEPLSPKEEEAFLSLIRQRCRNFPVAYLTGVREFYGRDFLVGPGILCPRPDSEILVEKALNLLKENPPSSHSETPLLDLCSGSGCIGLTMALEYPPGPVICADIDEAPQRAFDNNRNALNVTNARFVRSDLFENLKGPYAMILTNPPYLTTKETRVRMEEGWKEPPLALDGGHDGLDLIKKIIEKSIDYLVPEGYLLIEAAPTQMEAMEALMNRSGYKEVDTVLDLGGYKRVIYGRRQ